MKNFLNKFKIPTALGLSIIFLGLASGVFLILREQIFLSRATPDLIPQNITYSNITNSSVVVSWKTDSPASSFVSLISGGEQQTIPDDRDSSPEPHLVHYVTIKKLLPETHYQFKIISGKNTSELLQFETSEPLTSQSEFTPVIGSVLTNDTPLDEGIVYLSLSGAVVQSTLIKKGGNFLIPVSQIAKDDLSGTFSLTSDTPAKLTVRSGQGESNIQFNLKANLPPLPPIQLGHNVDLTTPLETPLPTAPALDKYDLNGDGKINSVDNSVILQNFGKKSNNNNADLNEDGIINQKDLDLMLQNIRSLGSQQTGLKNFSKFSQFPSSVIS